MAWNYSREHACCTHSSYDRAGDKIIHLLAEMHSKARGGRRAAPGRGRRRPPSCCRRWHTRWRFGSGFASSSGFRLTAPSRRGWTGLRAHSGRERWHEQMSEITALVRATAGRVSLLLRERELAQGHAFGDYEVVTACVHRASRGDRSLPLDQRTCAYDDDIPCVQQHPARSQCVPDVTQRGQLTCCSGRRLRASPWKSMHGLGEDWSLCNRRTCHCRAPCRL